MKFAVAALLFAGLTPMAFAQSTPCKSEPLNILLTNDDGYDTIGIKALHRALAKAGHRIKRVAPERNYSGSSASLTLDLIKAPQMPSDEFTDVFAVSGSPATTVLLGATALFTTEQPAQLVISGINEGANLGPATPISGTVGAAIAAIKTLNPPLPAIAVSTNLPSDDIADPTNLTHVANVAEFIARLVTGLQCAERAWSNGELALNVNYPPLAPDDIRGVRLAEQGQVSYFKIGFTPTGDGHYVPNFGAAPSAEESPPSDTALFNQGYITIVPIDGNYTAHGTNLPFNVEDLAP